MRRLLRWGCVSPLLVLLFLGLGCLYTLVPGGKVFFDPRFRAVPGWGNIGVPPHGGNCAYIGQDWPDNPFRGWPVKKFEGDWNTISTWFCDPNYFVGYTHWGIDIASLDYTAEGYIDGAEVVATAYGRVVRAVETSPPKWNWGMGNYIKIEALEPVTACECQGDEVPHDGQRCEYRDVNGDGIIGGYCWDEEFETGWVATYMHLKRVLVETGETVRPGDVIGIVDNTGNSTGPHLHYQINAPQDDGRPPDGAIDPAPAMSETYSNDLRQQRKGTR